MKRRLLPQRLPDPLQRIRSPNLRQQRRLVIDHQPHPRAPQRQHSAERRHAKWPLHRRHGDGLQHLPHRHRHGRHRRRGLARRRPQHRTHHRRRHQHAQRRRQRRFIKPHPLPAQSLREHLSPPVQPRPHRRPSDPQLLRDQLQRHPAKVMQNHRQPISLGQLIDFIPNNARDDG